MTVKQRTITLGAFSIFWLGMLALTPPLYADPPEGTARAEQATAPPAAVPADIARDLVPRLIPSSVPDSPLNEIPVLVPKAGGPVVVQDIVIDEADFEPPTAWEPVQESVLREMEPVLAKLELEIERLQREAGSEKKFLELVEKNAVEVKIPGLGKAQLNRVKARNDSDEKVLFVDGVHYGSEKALMYLDRNRIDPNSRHLKRIRARQKMYSGIVDARGKKSGRDTVEIWQDGSRPLMDPIVETIYHPRELPGSAAWWSDFWAHLYDGKRTASHKFMSVFGMTTQVGFLALANYAKIQLGWDDGWDMFPLAISAVFGGIIGLYSDVYKGLTTEGSDANRAMKMSLVSVIHTFSYAGYHEGVWRVFRFWDKTGLMLHAQLWTNILLGKVGRIAWSELPRIREWRRENPTPYKFSYFGLSNVLKKVPVVDRFAPRPIEVNRAQYEHQWIYTVPFMLGWIGRAGIAKDVGAERSIKLDGGDLTLLASIPVANLFVWAYSKWAKYPKEPEFRAKMLKSMKAILIYPIPGMLYRWFRDYGKEVYYDHIPLFKRTAGEVVLPAVKRRCHALVGKLSTRSSLGER